MYPISTIKGVEDVSFYGNTPYEWVVTFDYDIAKSLGITADDISKAFADRYSENVHSYDIDPHSYDVDPLEEGRAFKEQSLFACKQAAA